VNRRRERGQYVKELVNEGVGMTGLRIGVVTQAGPKQRCRTISFGIARSRRDSSRGRYD